MLLFCKILSLLWLINFTPPLLAHFLEDKWNHPLDFGRCFTDGKPWLGSHKTHRGVLGGMATGLLIGMLFGFPWWVGFLAGFLSMTGDILSSFMKRRWGFESGEVVAGLDQVFEGLFPFLVLGPYHALGPGEMLVLLAIFSTGAYFGSVFFKEILSAKPYETYPRHLSHRVRLREFRSCQVTSNPLHHFLNFEDAIYYHIFMKTVFRALGIYERGKQNALQLERSDVTFTFPDLPPAFDDYTILFLSDLHLDGLEGLTEKLQSILAGISVDLCIMGGDMRMQTYGPFDKALSHLNRLIPHIRAKDGILGVLGNHDCTEIMTPLEKIGIQVPRKRCHIDRA